MTRSFYCLYTSVTEKPSDLLDLVYMYLFYNLLLFSYFITYSPVLFSWFVCPFIYLLSPTIHTTVVT
uniref:Uncharacterized protein n=1 Tax=Anguilla anguilla TaxID=7936 RepID=A0A0E9PS20_ANGAN